MIIEKSRKFYVVCNRINLLNNKYETIDNYSKEINCFVSFSSYVAIILPIAAEAGRLDHIWPDKI